MTDRVTIQDQNEARFLSFDLQEVLSVLPPVARAFSWRLLELHGEGKPTSGLDWFELQQQIETTREGVEYRWTQLTALASGIFQSYDLTLVGSRDQSLRCELPIDLKKLHDFVLIEAVDSSYWKVTSDVPDVIDALATSFNETQVERNVA